MATTVQSTSGTSTYRHELRRGALAVLPFWAGAVPFGLAIGVSARTAGFSSVESIALSALAFAGAAQVATVSLFAGGASLIAITLTTFFMNLRHVFYGLSLDRQIVDRPRPPRPVLAFFMIDETYGMATRDHMEGRGGHAFFFGASLSLYLVYCLSTAVGVLLGSVLPEPERLGFDMIFPLMFVALIMPLLRTRRHILVASVSALLAVGLSFVAGGGTTVLVTILAGASLGAYLERV